jgi:hypothetical protein
MTDEDLAKLKSINKPQRVVQRTDQTRKKLDEPVSQGASSTILDVEYEELKQNDENVGSTPKTLTKQTSHMQI